MNVSIHYRLSDVGRKADLIAGGTGEQYQDIPVPSDHPSFSEVVQMGNVRDNSVDLYVRNAFDSPQTIESLVAAEKVFAEEAAKEKRQKEEEARKAAENVLAQRQTLESHVWVHGRNVPQLKPDWPRRTPTEIEESTEAQAWMEELQAINDAAEAAAKAEYDAEQAEKARKEEEDAAAKAAFRASLGLAENETAHQVVDGCLTSVPVWESHRRGKNWLAVITSNPRAPGGLDRDFAPKCRGEYFYDVSDIEDSSPVEFGADYYTGGGSRRPERWYGVLRGRTEAKDGILYVILAKADDAKSAIGMSESVVAAG